MSVYLRPGLHSEFQNNLGYTETLAQKQTKAKKSRPLSRGL